MLARLYNTICSVMKTSVHDQLLVKKNLKQYGHSPHLTICQKEIVRMLVEIQNYVSVMPCCLCMP